MGLKIDRAENLSAVNQATTHNRIMSRQPGYNFELTIVSRARSPTGIAVHYGLYQIRKFKSSLFDKFRNRPRTTVQGLNSDVEVYLFFTTQFCI